MRLLLLCAALAVLLVAVAAQYAQPQDQFQVSAAYEELSQDLPLQGEVDSDSDSEIEFDISAIRRLRSCPRGFKTFDVPLAHRPYWHKYRHAHRFRWAGPNREFMCVPFNLVKGVDPVFTRLRGRRYIHRDPLTDPELRRITQIEFATASESDSDVDSEMIISAEEVDNVQTELQEIKQKEEKTLSPRMIRLRDLFSRGGAAMRKVKEGTAGVHELEELKSVRLGLSNEFRSYPADLQEQIRPSYNKIDKALGIVINKLQMKLKNKGIDQVDEVQPVEEIEAESLDSSSDIAEDLLSLLTSVAAADMGVELPRDQTARFETSGIRGGWGFGGFGGFGGWGRKGFGWGGFGGWGLPIGLGYAAPLAVGYGGLGLGSWGYRGFGGFGYPFVGGLALGLGGYGVGYPVGYGLGFGGYGLGLGGFGLGWGGLGGFGGFGRGFGWGGRGFGRRGRGFGRFGRW